MKTCVIDASVIAAAFFNEAHAAKAARILSSGSHMTAPDLIHAELASIAWKRVQRKEITPDDASELLSDMRALPVTTTPIDALIDDAFQLALTTGRTVYDSLYLALAVRNKCVMWTADEKLVNSLANTPMKSFITSISR